MGKVQRPAVANDYIIQPKRHLSFNWLELWRYRELFFFFTWRDIKIKYKQTALGFLWAVLQPLFLMIIFSIFFGKALNVPSQELPYPVFVFSGLLLWNLFSIGLTNSANSMVSNAHIIKKVYFPRLIVPVSSVLVAMFDFLMAFIVFIGILLYYQQPVAIAALAWWPIAVLVSAMATLGPGCWLSALNVKYRDFRYVIPFLIQLLFFLSPVIYPASIASTPWVRYLIACSPMYAPIELFRMPLTAVSLDYTLIGISSASILVMLTWGLYYFRKTEDYFSDFA
ncbi:MAG: ABC transporter permease [Cyclobacteriaceae bacterium]